MKRITIASPQQEGTSTATLTKVATFLFAVVILWIGWRWFDIGKLTLAREVMGPLWRWFYWPALISASIFVAAYSYRTVLWLAYRPLASDGISDADLPSVTVIIPAFNEGPMVEVAMVSAIESRYPREKLHVICVDDGSRDDTFAHMEKVKTRFPQRITTLRFPKNRGKRHAVHAGIRLAYSDIIVTLDSDSMLEPGGLRELVAPFVLKSETGAVAGSVRVYNRGDNLITRMLGVRYILGFDFTRAYQSVLKTVLVCPGALSAYRREVIEPHLDAWLQQSFLGKRCTNGDDHALTNVVLRNHHATYYQSSARAFTVVPNTYPSLSRMFIRWARSNIRESWFYTHFSFQRAKKRGEWLALVDGWIHALQIPAQIYLTLFAFVLVLSYPGFLVRSLAFATAVSLIYVLYFLRSERSTECLFAVLYAWFSILALQWIYPWAAMTVGSNRWLTRNRPQHLAIEHRK